MASPPPTHGHGPIPDDTQAFDVGDFYTSPPLDDQGTKDFMSSQGFSNDHTGGFMVLEADLRSNPARWRMVSDLGGHALFLGRQSSKAVPAGECSGSQEDCIYFICDYPCPKSSTNPLHDAGIYNMRNGMIMPLHSGSAAVPQRQAGQWGLTWFFPPKVA
uniref:KIB1-4 beta-propeller domain-containing protein n=1 Tax=Aegilops tauschii subsp. strangulata TaxID=200361 RepID=A0A453N483_AEGTS